MTEGENGEAVFLSQKELQSENTSSHQTADEQAVRLAPNGRQTGHFRL